MGLRVELSTVTQTESLPPKWQDSWKNAEPWLLARYRWILAARPDQITPDGDWLVWLLLGGRGSGKTRTGAEDASDFCRQHPHSRYALVAPTIADVRDTMIEGESGILSVVPWDALRGGSPDKAWNRSTMELHFANGAQCKGFAGETPNRLRGPQHHRAWVDELAAFRYPQEAWDMLMMGLRLGAHPQAVVTTTPRPIRIVRELMKAATTHLTRASTYANLANLAPTFADQIIARYEGTRLGRQELMAELLEEAERALWHLAMFDRDGFYNDDVTLERIVVGVDPSGTPDGDACGIVAAGVWRNPQAQLHVLADRTLKASPEQWARVAVDLYRELKADRIVVEGNFGGQMAEALFHQIDPGVPVRTVHASRGKAVRAEPVVAIYEQERATHAHPFPELQDEMVSWEPGGESPNRIDALVWAATDLIIDGHGPATIHRPATATPTRSSAGVPAGGGRVGSRTTGVPR